MTPSEALERHAAVLSALHESRPVNTLRDWRDEHLIRESVAEGQTTLVGGEIGQAVEIAARGYPDAKLSESDLPFSNGFAWLEQPLSKHIVAISWLITYAEGRQGLAVVFWQVDPLGDVSSYLARWGFGEGWSSLPADAQVPARFLASLFAFMKQHIFVTRQVVAERHARKRVERLGYPHEPLIRVVQLRQREYLTRSEPPESAEHEWSCQWVVRGHWRQQFYPSKHGNQPLWITPYVKGPAEKPLKPPRATVFAVVR